ncbi:hypothetical protein [Terriglobus roseus]|uniref:Adenylate cyclase n=1 Tax=Terriglobus roseus TaxID=392734 RepID=A0A1H4L0M3_9BACT|nr:hypothetical protein [Terriglobus roseus]SEB64287.1 hypothetical protein SAMN05443244_1427 [Terriglobus roseus]
MQAEEGKQTVVSVTDRERQEALERVLISPLLNRSVRLRRFLSFVVEESMKDDAAALTEQRIGVALFDRSPSYDTGADNIVRVNATELRKRLEQFYSGDGIAETLLIEIPRGSYKPVFIRRTVVASATEEQPPAIEQQDELLPPVTSTDPALAERRASAVNSGSLLTRAAIAALVLVTALLAIQTYRAHSLAAQLEPWRAQPALQALWRNFFDSDTETTIVLADTSFAMAQDVSGYRLTLDDYQRHRFGEVAQQYALQPNGGAANSSVLSLLFSRYSGSIGDFYTARRILALQPASSAVKIQFARDFTGELLRHDSTILLGSTRSNPWVEPFQAKLLYRLQSSADGHSIEVHVEAPQSGEQSVYATSSDPNRTDGFCVIALMPSLGGSGKTMIIAGTDSQATEAGGDFVTQEATLKQLQARLPAASFDNFQLLLRTSRTSGSPLAAEIVSVRGNTAPHPATR